MPTAAEVLEGFLTQLRSLTPETWQTLDPQRWLRIIQFLRDKKDIYDNLTAQVAEISGLSLWEVETLCSLEDDAVVAEFTWRSLAEMGPGSNVERKRNWELYPIDGFFGDYLEYSLNCEGPIDFHFFSAAVALGSACRRNFVLRYGHSSVWPNLWAVVLAPSGVCRKTSSINIATRLLKSVPGIEFITTKATPESLVEQLKPKDQTVLQELGFSIHTTESHGFIAAPELGVFLGRQQYNEGLIQALTDLSDNPDEWSSGTKTKGTAELKNVALSLLGGITPDSARDCLPRSAHGGGFMSRILWIRADTTPRVIPTPPLPSPLLREKLRLHLRRIRDANPAVVVPTPDALEYFISWYQELRRADGDSLGEERFAGFIERKPTNLWRIAVLLYLAGSDPQVEDVNGVRTGYITLDQVKQAQAIMDHVTPQQYEAGAMVESAPVSLHMRYLKTALWSLTKQGVGEVQRSHLTRRLSNRMHRHEMDQLLITLIQSEEVTTVTRTQSGKETTYYRVGPSFRR